MYIHAFRVRNFRRLKDVVIELSSDISIFVGANNSGKTSASQAFQLLLAGARDRLSIYDFSSECWPAISAFGEGVEDALLPKMSLDIWFSVDEDDLHRVIDLLPSLSWQGSLVGLRVEFAAAEESSLLSSFIAARDRAKGGHRPGPNGEAGYHPRPSSLCQYLEDNLKREYEFRYYVLDYAQFDDSLKELDGYVPLQILSDKGRSGRDILRSILQVDFLSAQRHLSDTAGGARTEDLSRCLSRFYERNLEKRGDDFDAMRALAESEALLNDHLAKVFEPTLGRLEDLGYPGFTNPRLVIKSSLSPAALMGSYDGTRVHYALDQTPAVAEFSTLPDRYNGLGFKNLIYMVVELLDLHSQWMAIEDNRPPLHLIFIEEPEAHLHAQLQQAFIRKVLDILAVPEEEALNFRSQLVITTHSPHILYERGFKPIRYFRRCAHGTGQFSEVLNLSDFYAKSADGDRDFLERYLKLTHCDLFFADAAVLVEGNVERLLLPQMIEKSAPRLKSAYLSILEVGGAFGYRFRKLIDFLGITTLIISDIDSVYAAAENNDDEDESDADDQDAENEPKEGTACMASVADAVTSNQTLIQWLPARRTIAELLAATPGDRTQQRVENERSLVHMSYQSPVIVSWNGTTATLTGRTLEEAFAFENLSWCQHEDRDGIRLRIPRNATIDLEVLAGRLHRRIKGSKFNKTAFALGVLAENPSDWEVPTYIAGGLSWLQEQIMPPVIELPAVLPVCDPAVEPAQ